jgi:hypothetical protein
LADAAGAVANASTTDSTKPTATAFVTNSPPLLSGRFSARNFFP